MPYLPINLVEIAIHCSSACLQHMALACNRPERGARDGRSRMLNLLPNLNGLPQSASRPFNPIGEIHIA